jgi:type IV fimbrial biogenesis protein FimT
MPSRGFTLWELLVAVAVAAVALGLALPSFERLRLDMERVAAVNAFVGAVQLARSEAAKRARPVVLCKSIDLERCGGGEIGFDHGWMVFVNTDDVRPPHRAASEPLLRAHGPSTGIRISANRQLFEFRPFRSRSTNGTVTFCDRRGASEARAVIVSYTGRPRLSAAGPDRALSCAP